LDKDASIRCWPFMRNSTFGSYAIMLLVLDDGEAEAIAATWHMPCPMRPRPTTPTVSKDDDDDDDGMVVEKLRSGEERATAILYC